MKDNKIIDLLNSLPANDLNPTVLKYFNRSNNYRIYLVEYLDIEITVLHNEKLNKFVFLEGSKYFQITENIDRICFEKNLRKWKKSYSFINNHLKYKLN